MTSDGCSITLTGNIWQIDDDSVEIASDTTVTFDFSTNSSGEIHGIGFDDDAAAANETRIFKLSGSQDWGIQDFTYSGAGDVQRITIPVGEFYTGSGLRFVITNDNDNGSGDNVVTVGNVVLSTAPPRNCDDTALDLRGTSDYSSTNPGSSEVSADGCSISLSGNVWRIDDDAITISANTTVSFDFSSNNTGEIHGVGFDDDAVSANEARIFKLSGSQNWGIQDFTYTGAGDVQRITIPVGQFYTGSGFRFVITNDNDNGSGNNVVTVNNVVVSEQASVTGSIVSNPVESFAIVHKPTGLKFHSCGTSNNASVTAASANNVSECSQWLRIGNGDYFYLQNVVSGKFIRPDSISNGSPIVLRNNSSFSLWTQWSVEERGDGYFHLVNRATGKYVYIASDGEGGNILQQPSSWRGDFTRWKFK